MGFYARKVINIMNSIGANIRARRRALGMNQEELAQRLGVTQANISRIESSVKGPSASLLLALAGALQCDVHELLGVEDVEEKTDLEGGERTFVMQAIKSDPQLGVYLRGFVKDQGLLHEEDWKFLATTLRMGLSYAADIIRMRRKQDDKLNAEESHTL